MRTCNHCGDTFPDFDVAHVCSKGQYAPKLPAPNLRKAAQDEIADLIGWYWDIAYQEGKTGVSQGDRANYVLCQINAALRAALQSCPDCGKPTPEGSIHTCSPQKPDDSIDWEVEAANHAFTIGLMKADEAWIHRRLLEIMRKNGLATGHGDTIDDALKELDWQLSELKGKSDGTL